MFAFSHSYEIKSIEHLAVVIEIIGGMNLPKNNKLVTDINCYTENTDIPGLFMATLVFSTGATDNNH